MIREKLYYYNLRPNVVRIWAVFSCASLWSVGVCFAHLLSEARDTVSMICRFAYYIPISEG